MQLTIGVIITLLSIGIDIEPKPIHKCCRIKGTLTLYQSCLTADVMIYCCPLVAILLVAISIRHKAESWRDFKDDSLLNASKLYILSIVQIHRGKAKAKRLVMTKCHHWCRWHKYRNTKWRLFSTDSPLGRTAWEENLSQATLFSDIKRVSD